MAASVTQHDVLKLRPCRSGRQHPLLSQAESHSVACRPHVHPPPLRAPSGCCPSQPLWMTPLRRGCAGLFQTPLRPPGARTRSAPAGSDRSLFIFPGPAPLSSTATAPLTRSPTVRTAPIAPHLAHAVGLDSGHPSGCEVPRASAFMGAPSSIPGGRVERAVRSQGDG